MRKRFIVLTTLFPIAAWCASSGASAQVPVTAPVAVPAFQDSAVAMTLRKAREVAANAQRLLEDTTVVAAANRAFEKAAALSVRLRDLDAQQAALQQRLQQTDAQLHTMLQQMERMQRRLDEMMRQLPN